MSTSTLTWLQQQCQQHLLPEKWLLCDSLRTAQTWKDRIPLAGTPCVNLHTKTLRTLAASLVAPQLAAEKRVSLTHTASVSLLQDLFEDERKAGTLKYFHAVQHIEGLAKLLAATIRDLRMAAVAPNDIPAKAFEAPDKAADVSRLYQKYGEALQARSLVDEADCLQLATVCLAEKSVPLPNDLIILQPQTFETTTAEQNFLNQLAASAKLNQPTPEDAESPTLPNVARTSFFQSYGEVNEVRGVLQKTLGPLGTKTTPFDDVEIVYADERYIPLIFEFLEERVPESDVVPIHPPVTFSSGLACIYSRPGKALRAWLRWIRSDALQAKAVQLLREGVLNRPEGQTEEDPIGYSRLASTLRRLSIGFQRDRYLPAIDAAIVSATERQRQASLAEQRNNDSDETSATGPAVRDFGLPALDCLRSMMEPLIELAPNAEDSAGDVLHKAKQFLLRCARHESKVDRQVRSQLLSDIDRRAATLEYAHETAEGVLKWLEDLPVESSVLQSGPQPGCLFVSPVTQAGISGRSHHFVVGLDANTFPRSRRVDPLLLDSERAGISKELPTSTDRAARHTQQLLDLIRRTASTAGANVAFSWSNRDLVADRDQPPSPLLVDLFRQIHDRPDADLDDLLAHADSVVTFTSTDNDHWLNRSDQTLVDLLTTDSEAARQAAMESEFTHARVARLAAEQRGAVAFSEFDGRVPAASAKLNPAATDAVLSPSRLETFGTCPRRFFFRHGLGVTPPDEYNVDPERWLDPISVGNLVHSLFEDFMRELTTQNEIPNVKRDRERLMTMLDQQVQDYLALFPKPNADAFERQKEWLIETCDIFLQKEQEYCEQTGARPWVVEASIGLNEELNSPLDCSKPVPLKLNDGKVLNLGGRIDRVDRIHTDGSESYAIWDYKTGSDWSFNEADPFRQGRKLQSWFYVGMLRHRLAATDVAQGAATVFGYFFPNPKTEGRRIQWAQADLLKGDELIQRICDMIELGSFPATTDAQDCKYCDYRSVCHDPERVARQSYEMTIESTNQESLYQWAELRDLADFEPPPF